MAPIVRGIRMRSPASFAVIAISVLLFGACNRNESDPAPAAQDAIPSEQPSAQTASPADTTPARPATDIQEPSSAPPAPVVEGMYVVYACDNGTEPRITFAGNLVKVELTVESAPVILSRRASPTNTSDTYSDDTLTLHRDGLGITLDLGGGTATRCTEKEASA